MKLNMFAAALGVLGLAIAPCLAQDKQPPAPQPPEAKASAPAPAPAPASAPTPGAPAARVETWEGEIVLGAEKLGFVVHFTSPTSATLDIPAQGVLGAPLVDVKYSAKEIAFTFKPGGSEEAKAVFSAVPNEAEITKASGTLAQGQVTAPMTMKLVPRGEAAAGTPKRPQEPKPPFPYTSREVSFSGGAEGVTLFGTLTIPDGKGPFCAVSLVTGSGPQDRDETLLGHKPFLVIADYLSRAGIAVLRVNDRGVPPSSGDFAKASTLDFAADAEKAFEFLKAQPEIDPKHVGIMGHSEGGVVAPIVASRRDDVAFIVLLAGTATTGEQVLRDQMRAILLAAYMEKSESALSEDQKKALELALKKASDEELTSVVKRIAESQVGAISTPEAVEQGVKKQMDMFRSVAKQILAQQELLALAVAQASDEELAPVIRRLIEAQSGGAAPPETVERMVQRQIQAMHSPWMQTFLKLDPRDYLTKVKCPVLALDGSLDTQVIAAINLPEIERALKAAGNKDATVQTLPGLNHLFQTAHTGSPGEYTQIEETFAPVALEAVGSWIKAYCR